MEQRQVVKERLAESREALLAVARELDPEDWSQPVYAHEEEEWTAGDLLRHLVWAEGGMLRMIRQVKEGGEGVPEDFDLDRYNASGVRKLKEKMPAELLALMAENRRQLLALIDELEPEDWEKEGRHGSMHILTIAQVIDVIASHEEWHLDDLRQALGRI